MQAHFCESGCYGVWGAGAGAARGHAVLGCLCRCCSCLGCWIGGRVCGGMRERIQFGVCNMPANGMQHARCMFVCMYCLHCLVHVVCTFGFGVATFQPAKENTRDISPYHCTSMRDRQVHCMHGAGSMYANCIYVVCVLKGFAQGQGALKRSFVRIFLRIPTRSLCGALQGALQQGALQQQCPY